MNGVNLCLAMVGHELIWLNVLKKFNYTEEQILSIVAGPSHTAWWLMGNLEGQGTQSLLILGGPVTVEYINKQYSLQLKILERLG